MRRVGGGVTDRDDAAALLCSEPMRKPDGVLLVWSMGDQVQVTRCDISVDPGTQIDFAWLEQVPVARHELSDGIAEVDWVQRNNLGAARMPGKVPDIAGGHEALSDDVDSRAASGKRHSCDL